MSGAGIVAREDRKPRFFAIIFVIALLTLALAPAYAAAECTVHGSVYDWATFSTLDNAVVKVYSIADLSLLQGNVVTKKGSYSFSLPRGDYMIMASAGTPGTPDEITATENLTVPDSGERIIDLILFPPGSLDDLSGFTDTNATPTLPPEEDPVLLPNPTEQPSQGNWALWIGGGAIALAIAAIAAGLLLLRALRPKKTDKTWSAAEAPAKTEITPPAPEPVVSQEEKKQAAQPPQPVQPAPVLQQPSVQDLLLPEDCRQVLAIIEKNDGRITQLDLRKMLPYSEAKVSLIVSDLENRGLVKKIKKGRGNVLILNRPGERPPEK
jgi:uncharacterized membrane protein